jgi:hypothetical protein
MLSKMQDCKLLLTILASPLQDLQLIGPYLRSLLTPSVPALAETL